MRRRLKQKKMDLKDQLRQSQVYASLGIDATLVERVPDGPRLRVDTETPRSVRRNPRRRAMELSMPNLARNSTSNPPSPLRPQSWIVQDHNIRPTPPQTEPPKRRIFGRNLLRRKSTSEFASDLRVKQNSYSRLTNESGEQNEAYEHSIAMSPFSFRKRQRSVPHKGTSTLSLPKVI